MDSKKKTTAATASSRCRIVAVSQSAPVQQSPTPSAKEAEPVAIPASRSATPEQNERSASSPETVTTKEENDKKQEEEDKAYRKYVCLVVARTTDGASAKTITKLTRTSNIGHTLQKINRQTRKRRYNLAKNERWELVAAVGPFSQGSTSFKQQWDEKMTDLVSSPTGVDQSVLAAVVHAGRLLAAEAGTDRVCVYVV